MLLLKAQSEGKRQELIKPKRATTHITIKLLLLQLQLSPASKEKMKRERPTAQSFIVATSQKSC